MEKYQNKVKEIQQRVTGDFQANAMQTIRLAELIRLDIEHLKETNIDFQRKIDAIV